MVDLVEKIADGLNGFVWVVHGLSEAADKVANGLDEGTGGGFAHLGQEGLKF